MSQVEINNETLDQIHVILLDEDMDPDIKYIACMIGLMSDISANMAIIADKLMGGEKNE